METRFQESVRRQWRAPVGEGARRLAGRATCEVRSAGARPPGRPGDACAAGFSLKRARKWQKMPDYDIRDPLRRCRPPLRPHPHVSVVGEHAGREGTPSPRPGGRPYIPLRPPLGTAFSGIFCHFPGRRRENRRGRPRTAGPGGRDRTRLRHPGQKRGHGQKTIGSGNMTRQGPPIAYGFPPYNASEMQITIGNGNADRQLPMPPCRYLWIPA